MSTAPSLASALRLPWRRYLRSRWPWRALWWLAQASVAGWVLFGLVALAVFPATTRTWDLSAHWGWWLLEIAAIGFGVVGFVLVGGWQRRAVKIIGFPPIASRSAWLTPGARRGFDLIAGALQDLIAGVAIIAISVVGTLLAWFCWLWPTATIAGAIALTLWTLRANFVDFSENNVVLSWIFALVATVLFVLLPWLWGWVALGSARLLGRIYDRRGDVARRQAAERQAATTDGHVLRRTASHRAGPARRRPAADRRPRLHAGSPRARTCPKRQRPGAGTC